MDWMRRHSPLKNRDKPLPSAPADNSPPRSPIKPISGNTSPSKSSSKPHGQRTRNSWTRDNVTLPSDQTKDSRVCFQSKHSAGEMQSQPKRIIRLRRPSRDKSTTEVYNLTKRVSSLETQLEEAKKELRTVIGSGNSTQRISSADLPRGTDPTQIAKGRRTRSAEYGEKRNLESEQIEHCTSTSRPEKVCRDNDTGHCNVTGGEHSLGPQHKRKRSELRQATWKHIQNHILDIQHQEPSSKKSKRVQEIKLPQYNKQLPPSPGDKYDGGIRFVPTDLEEISHNTAASLMSEKRAADPKPKVALQNGHHAPQGSSTSVGQADGQADVVADLPNFFKEALYQHSDDVFSPQRQEETNELEQGEEDTSKFYISRPPSPSRRYVPSPSRLDPVNEEFEWDDDEIF